MRIVEVYSSAQGEGINTGEITVFTRFAGCNLRCSGWPCDTEFAIEPGKYRQDWHTFEVDELGDMIVDTAKEAGAGIITLTGGEPFLQPEHDLRNLVHFLKTKDFVIDCFSNGTMPYPKWATDSIYFIMDWKLDGSGEDYFGADNPTRLRNLDALASSPLEQGIKFVIKDESDFYQAMDLYNEYLDETDITVYYGKVWEGKVTDAWLVAQVMKHKLPWRLNVQMHNYIWDPSERGR